MRKQWLAVEHYRLHAIESWPASTGRDALLAAVRSAIGSLAGDEDAWSTDCAMCAERRRSASIVDFPKRPLSGDSGHLQYTA